jgi:hypothetical protein
MKKWRSIPGEIVSERNSQPSETGPLIGSQAANINPRLEAFTEAQCHLHTHYQLSFFNSLIAPFRPLFLNSFIFLNRFSLQALEHDFQKQLAVAAEI